MREVKPRNLGAPGIFREKGPPFKLLHSKDSVRETLAYFQYSDGT